MTRVVSRMMEMLFASLSASRSKPPPPLSEVVATLRVSAIDVVLDVASSRRYDRDLSSRLKVGGLRGFLPEQNARLVFLHHLSSNVVFDFRRGGGGCKHRTAACWREAEGKIRRLRNFQMTSPTVALVVVDLTAHVLWSVPAGTALWAFCAWRQSWCLSSLRRHGPGRCVAGWGTIEAFV